MHDDQRDRREEAFLFNINAEWVAPLFRCIALQGEVFLSQVIMMHEASVVDEQSSLMFFSHDILQAPDGQAIDFSA